MSMGGAIAPEPKVACVWHEGETTFVEVTVGKRAIVIESSTKTHRLFPARAARDLAAALGKRSIEISAKDLAKAIAPTLPEIGRRRPKRRTPTKDRLRKIAEESLAKRPSLEITDAATLLEAYRSAKDRGWEGTFSGPDPGKHPDAERQPPKVGDPLDAQIVAIVEGHGQFGQWSDVRSRLSDAEFGQAVIEELRAEWRRRGNSLPVVLYGPFEGLCEAEVEALGAVENTDDAEGRLRPGMRRSHWHVRTRSKKL